MDLYALLHRATEDVAGVNGREVFFLTRLPGPRCSNICKTVGVKPSRSNFSMIMFQNNHGQEARVPLGKSAFVQEVL